MIWLITKYLMTAAVVVVVSEVAKRSDKLGALIAALPLVTLLALDLVENCPWRRSALVADDAVILESRNGVLLARSSERIAGLVELRGFGVVRLRRHAAVEIVAAFDLEAGFERMPEPRRFEAAGGSAPVYPFRPDRPAASAALRVALRTICGGQS